MKKFLLLILTITYVSIACSQDLKFGAKLSTGSGFLKSKNLKDYFESEKSNDPDVKTYDLKSGFGFAFSIGGFVEYSLSDKISLLGELSFQSISPRLTIDYMEDDAQSGLSFRETVISKNKFSIASLNIPLLGRYYINESMFINGGVGFDFIFSNKLEADETITEEDFDGAGNVTGTSTITLLNTADMEMFKSPRMSLVLGAGTVFDLGSNGLVLDLRYNLPLTKSEMYTSDVTFNNNTERSDVFGVVKKMDIEQNSSFKLDDYKLGTLMLTVGYRF